MPVGVIISDNGAGGPLKQAVASSSGMIFVPGKGWTWFGVKRFKDLTDGDIDRWMRKHKSEAEIEGFRKALAHEKWLHRQAVASGKIGWVATEIFWPRGLSEALMHDFPQEFMADYMSSRNEITANFERVLQPFIICGKYRRMTS